MKITKKITSVIALLAISTFNFAFDWPQNEIMSDSFFSYFGQLRGGKINPSIVFSNTEYVKASDDGRVVCLLKEHNESDLFESTLGNAVILAHKDDMMTVYANLYDVEKFNNVDSVKTGESLGETALSGWQEGDACLEFQVIDTLNKCFINPRVLMPRFGDELELVLHNVTGVNKAGISYTFSTVKTLNAGSYLLYNDRQSVTIPYKCSIYLNGAIAEKVIYDSLYEINGELNIRGKENHPLKEIYPDSNRQFIGQIVIPKGHNELTIIISDILGKEQQATYIFDAR